MKILIFGVPSTPIFEVGEKVSRFHDLDYYTLEREHEIESDYFKDMYPTTDLDTGDFSSGSESQSMSRDPGSVSREKALGQIEFVEYDESYLDCDERIEVSNFVNCVFVTEIADPFLVDWADSVILLETDLEVLKKWIVDRRKCFSCGAIYHKQDKPSKVNGICDRCGTDLKRRVEDQPSVVDRQFKKWDADFKEFKDLVDKNNKLGTIKVDKCKDFDDLFGRVETEIQKKTKGWWSYEAVV